MPAAPPCRRLALAVAVLLAACNQTQAAATCTDHIRNGTETDVDCGGSCPACADGKSCAIGADCADGVCGPSHACLAATCSDGVQNGGESDVDCGHACGARLCADGKKCVVAGDCASSVCGAGHTCSAATCTDGVKNGGESDVDCGHACGARLCADGKGCVVAGDCASSVCGAGHTCSAPTCTDGVKNGGESDVDCGQACGTRLCADGKGCVVAGDCASSVCGAGHTCSAATCTDHVKNGAETDVDCGGGTCTGCALGQKCLTGGDCASGACGAAQTCIVPATCSDGVKNGSETDIDCGGPACSACAAGRTCAVDSDCLGGLGCGPGGVCGSIMAPSSSPVSVLSVMHDAKGALHVLTYEGATSGAYCTTYYTTVVDHVLANGAWTRATAFTTPSGWNLNAGAATVTSTGEIVLVIVETQYCSTSQRQTDVPYIAYLPAGGAWTSFVANGASGPLIQGSTEYGSGGGLTLGVDGSDTIHAVVSYYAFSGGLTPGILHYNWKAGTNGVPVSSSHQALSSTWAGGPGVFIGTDGIVRVVFHDYYTGNPYVYASSSDGTTFSSGTFSSRQTYAGDYFLPVTSDGTNVWMARSTTTSTEILQRTSTGWSSDFVSPLTGSWGAPAFNRANGSLRMFYLAAATSTDVARLRLVNRGTSGWSSPVDLDGAYPGVATLSFAVAGSTWPAFNRSAATTDLAKVWQTQVSPSKWTLLHDVR